MTKEMKEITTTLKGIRKAIKDKAEQIKKDKHDIKKAL